MKLEELTICKTVRVKWFDWTINKMIIIWMKTILVIIIL